MQKDTCYCHLDFQNQNAGNLRKILGVEVKEASAKLLQLRAEF